MRSFCWSLLIAVLGCMGLAWGPSQAVAAARGSSNEISDAYAHLQNDAYEAFLQTVMNGPSEKILAGLSVQDLNRPSLKVQDCGQQSIAVGSTPLMCLMYVDISLDQREALLRAYLARLTSKKGTLDVQNEHGRGVLGHAALAFGAAEASLFGLLLEAKPNLDLQNEDGDSALFEALDRQHYELASALLAAGADGQLMNYQGQTPLLRLFASAGQGEHAPSPAFVDVLRQLLQQGADPNASIEQADLSPLTRAVSFPADWSAVVEVLLEHGADVNRADVTGRTPLLHAAIMAQDEVLARLIEKGAELDRQDSSGDTALMHAVRILVRGQQESTAAFLLLSAGADVGLRNRQGKSALDFAMHDSGSEGAMLMVQQILSKDPDLSYADAHGATAFTKLVQYRDFYWPVFDDYLMAKADGGRLLIKLMISANWRLFTNEDTEFLLNHLNTADRKGELSVADLQELEKKSLENQRLLRWFDGSKRKRIQLHRMRDSFLRHLRLVAAAKRHQTQVPSPLTTSVGRAGEACTICAEDFSQTAQEQGAPAACQSCFLKNLRLGGKFSDFAIKLPPELQEARANEMTSADIITLFAAHNPNFKELAEQLAEIEVERLREDLKQIPGWRFCSFPGCFNGKVVDPKAKDALSFDCELCGHKACLGCGDDHVGSCDREERSRVELERLIAQGRLAPNADAPEEGRFRPCYHCGTLTERVDGCTAMRCAACKRDWDWNDGDPALNPRFGSDFTARERRYEPLVPAHL